MSRLNRQECEKFRNMLDDEAFLSEVFFFSSPKTGKKHIEEFRMWLDGATYKEIASKFNLSSEYIRQNLIKATSILDRHYMDLKDLPPDASNIDKFFNLIEKAACYKGLGYLTANAGNAFIRAQKNWDYDTDFIKLLKEMSEDEIKSIHNIGSRSSAILLRARKVLLDDEDEIEKEEKLNLFKKFSAVAEDVAKEHGFTDNCVTRAKNALWRINHEEPDWFNVLLNTPDDVLMTLWNVGNKTLTLLSLIRDRLIKEGGQSAQP